MKAFRKIIKRLAKIERKRRICDSEMRIWCEKMVSKILAGVGKLQVATIGACFFFIYRH